MFLKLGSIVLILALLLAPVSAHQNSAQSASGDPWARVRFLVGDEKVDVTTKSGLTLRGVLVRFEWEAVSLRDKKEDVHILKREEIAEIRTVASRAALFRPMAGGAVLGATAGMIGGGVASIDVPKNDGRRRFLVGMGIGAAVGTAVGYLFGKSGVRHARVVYTAPPNNTTPAPASSPTDQPHANHD